MRVETNISSYSEEQARKNLKRAAPFLLFWFILFLTGLDYLPTYVNFGRLTAAVNFVSGLAFMYGLLQFFVPYSNYMAGLKGERKVIQNISDKLGSEHSLFNDIKFKDGRKENIDHIIVGPRGIFAIETKNPRIDVEVDGDNWKGFLRSPSSQAKRHARRIYQVLRDANSLDAKIPLVKAVVVLANTKQKPKIVREPDLCKVITIKNEDRTSLYDYVMKQDIIYSTEEIEEIVDILHDRILRN